ncbi:Zinc-binding carboxypeptidase [Giardia duodenalis]|uniref:Zinc-binding carboxypeptidase n=1 Tax=Giardia intestinalis TaxID=5741 RepID=V6TDV1_GIAIN|nr:Zinc-binding carboxypeptidase [Giardia intestinalis]
MLDLNFEAKFEGGNLQSFERISPCEYDLYVRPDAGSNSCLWFYFCVNSIVINKPFLFHIIGFSKITTTFQTEQTPLVRSTSRTKWEHIPKSLCWYGNVVPRHKLKTQSRVLSFLFQFDKDENYFFAFTYPYTYSMLTKFLARIKDHRLSYTKIVSLGRTTAGNDIQVVLISQDIHTMQPITSTSTSVVVSVDRSSSNFTRGGMSTSAVNISSSMSTGANRAASALSSVGTATAAGASGLGTTSMHTSPRSINTNFGWQTKDKRVVLVTARVHSGEVPSSFVMHGLLEYLTTNDPRAKFLREKVVFILIPMVNPDGCSAGNYRANASGYDLNRCYKNPSLEFHKEAYKLRRLFLNLILSYKGYAQYSRKEDAESGFTRQILNRSLLDVASSLNLTEDLFAPITPESGAVRGDTVTPPQTSSASLFKRSIKTSDDLTISWEPGTEILAGLRLDYVLDLHSHSCLSGGFLFYNPDSCVLCGNRRHICELVFPTLLAKKCLAFGAIRQDDKVGVQLRDTPGSLRRIFNLLGKQYCQDNGPYVYGMEVTNSHGPDPSLDHADLNVRLLEEADDEDNETDADERTVKPVIYTPKHWLTIGEKIGETFYTIYSSLPYPIYE